MKTFRRAALLAVLAWTAFAVLARAEDLPQASPEEVGLSSERLQRIGEWLRADSEDKAVPGAVVLIARHGKVAYFESFGMRDPAIKAPMTKDAIFRIYSMSKPIATVAAMMLFEEGKLTLDQPVAKYIPAFAKMQVAAANTPGPAADPKTITLVPPVRAMTLQDLMRHSSGLTYGFFGDTPVKKAYFEANLFDGNFDNAEFVERLAKLPLSYQPGTIWDYSHSTDVLGRVIEIVSGRSLFQFEQERLLDPLGMKDTSFYVTEKSKQDRIAEPFAEDRSFGAGTNFNDPRIARKWESAGGGMVGTAMDYARFLQMLLNGGALDGKRYLGPKTIAYMTSDHLGKSIMPGPYYLPGPGYSFGLGFAVRVDAGVSAHAGSVGEFNWGGAGGTAFWVDPKEDMLVVFMMQSPKQRLPYRPKLRDMVYAAIVN